MTIELATVAALKRRRPDPRVNLSSNELLHREVDVVLAEALADLGPSLLRRYPVTGAALDEIATYLELATDEFMLTPGSDCTLRLLTWRQARLGRGGLLLQWPNYDAWEDVAVRAGLAVERVSGTPESVHMELCEAARRSSGRLVVLSTPNGPSGWTTPEPVLNELAEIAAERDHLLVVDSCYQVFDGPLTAQLRRRGGNVVVVQTLSKSHGLAGGRVAVLAAEPSLVAELAGDRLEQTVSALSVEVARAVLGRADVFTRIWSEIATSRERASVALSTLGYPPLASGGNFLTVPVGSQTTARALVERFSQRGYRLRELTADQGLAGHIRFTIVEAELTEEVVDVFSTLVEAPPP